MTNRDRIKRIDELLKKAELYGRAVGKIDFDMQCCAPTEGMAQAGEDIALLEQVPFEILHSAEYVELLSALHENGEGLEPLESQLVKQLWKDYEKTRNITPELSLQFDMDYAGAYAAWLSAKRKQDFSLFRDSFAKLIANTRKEIDLRGERRGTYYDVCLDDFEPGGSIAQLDAFFEALKARILPLLEKIRTRGKSLRTEFLTRPVEIAKQEAFSRVLLEREGLRKDALVLMTTEHPFTTHFGPHDVRVTTHYYEDNFISNIFSTLHEGGHALFMQNEPEAFYENHVADHMTSAMHECMSRFFENIIGRSEAFVHAVYPEVQAICGDTFADVSEREFYEAINLAEPGLIRMDADELTYPLHILIRYELEKAFINGEITVDEIPALWREKYKTYLGVEPQNDEEGALQDVHWSGSYGYFPSYALGSAYGAQILHVMEKDFDVWDSVSRGDLLPIADWLKNHAFNCASVMDPAEWIVAVTGEPFNVNYFLDYLEDKFTKIYGL